MVFGLGKKKSSYDKDDFIIGNKDIIRFKSSKRKISKEEKRKAKNEAMKFKAKRIREKNQALSELESAKQTRSDIRRKQFKRRTGSLRRGVSRATEIIDKVRKQTRTKKKISSSPFAPEKW